MPIRVKVLYFGQARDASGRGEEDLVLPDRASVRSLLESISSKRSGIGRIARTMQVAVNEEISGAEARLNDGDVVALLPPVAGG